MKYRFESSGSEYEIVLERQGQGYRATIDGQEYELEILSAQPGQLSLRFENRPVVLYWAVEGEQKWISTQGCAYRLGKPSPRRERSPGQPAGENSLRAPMPAQVVAILASAGESAEPGQTLMLLEAMKMEIRLQAPRGGRIARVLVKPGQTVEREQVLIEFEHETTRGSADQ